MELELRDKKVFSRVGMWLFILSEILIFGGLFLLYAMYRAKHPGDFHAGSMELSRFDGTLNTIILLTSSLTAALAVFSMQDLNKPRRTALYLAATIACGLGFLVVKSFEWGATRPARDHRHGHPLRRALVGDPEQSDPETVGDTGERGPVLAPRGRHLDLPLPAVLPHLVRRAG